MNFSSTKETVQCLGHLMRCQELINDLLIGVATEKAQSDDFSPQKLNTTVSHAKYDVQVRILLPANSAK
eukprot:15186349-Ditylum_brightwellii.AAC.1